ncbi:MAG: F-box protein [Candidatus Babeliales bacterium]|jgi:hypothetical protein
MNKITSIFLISFLWLANGYGAILKNHDDKTIDDILQRRRSIYFTFQRLPNELMKNIASFTDLRDIPQIQRSCRATNEFVHSLSGGSISDPNNFISLIESLYGVALTKEEHSMVRSCLIPNTEDWAWVRVLGKNTVAEFRKQNPNLLFIAIKLKYQPLIAFFLKIGVSTLDSRNSLGLTPLSLAIANDDIDLVELILQLPEVNPNCGFEGDFAPSISCRAKYYEQRTIGRLIGESKNFDPVKERRQNIVGMLAYLVTFLAKLGLVALCIPDMSVGENLNPTITAIAFTAIVLCIDMLLDGPYAIKKVSVDAPIEKLYEYLLTSSITVSAVDAGLTLIHYFKN